MKLTLVLALLFLFSVANADAQEIPKYNRKEWKLWIDADGDCLNTRMEVLLDEQVGPFLRHDCKKVYVGQWIDPYTIEILTDAKRIDIDHMVPLQNAHYSGGWAWSKERKEAYANDLSNPDHLVATHRTWNRKKKHHGPDKRKPPNRETWCWYAWAWIGVKTRWGLTFTVAEFGGLKEMIETCP